MDLSSILGTVNVRRQCHRIASLSLPEIIALCFVRPVMENDMLGKLLENLVHDDFSFDLEKMCERTCTRFSIYYGTMKEALIEGALQFV